MTPLVSLTELMDLTALIVGNIPLTPPVRNRLTRRNGIRCLVLVKVLLFEVVLWIMFSVHFCLVRCPVRFGVPMAILRGWPLLT